MQLKILVGAIIVFGIYALITRPFQSRRKVKEFFGHLAIAFLCYYVGYTVLFFGGVGRTAAISASIVFATIVIILVNAFGGKT